MTFNPLAALNSVELSQYIKNKNNIIDMGSQTPSLGPGLFDILIKKYLFLNKSQINNLKYLKEKIIGNKPISTKEFFISLNFKRYESIDINGAYDSHLFDLNLDIKEKYNFNKKYNFVINNGTGEHVFNQYSLLKNMHQLCNESGIMLHILPFIDWVNHGFYNFNPIFFADLAESNNYEILKLSLANRNGDEIIFNKNHYQQTYEQVKPQQKQSFLGKVLNISETKLGKNILIVCALRKLKNKKFIIPLQGKYLDDVKKNLMNKYKNQKGGSKNAKNQVPDNKKRN